MTVGILVRLPLVLSITPDPILEGDRANPGSEADEEAPFRTS